MSASFALAALALSAGVYAQQPGTLTTETHPKMSISRCSAGGSCTTEQHTVVLDANWRWLHSTSGSTNCYDGNKWSTSLCPDPTTCAANCALDGGDYTGTYGITASGNSLSMKLVTGSNVGSRVYLMDTSDSKYEMFNLLGQEFTVDVDTSALPCGLNGALYFVSMDADGGQSKFPTNKAGAKYGTGYCDSQCPQDIKFIDGVANSAGWTGTTSNSGTGSNGACCSEMDIWEANSVSTAYTPHPCSPVDYEACTSDAECGVTDRSSGFCDKSGCDFNSYRMGNTSFYGPGKTLDSNKKMTVVTQFITNDGTSSGTLIEIKRIYVQNGIVYQNSQSNIAGVTGNSITDSFCAAQKTAFGDGNDFKAKGGLAAMGNAFKKGMVLVLSIWDDYAVSMLWLDAPFPATADPTAPGVTRGTCSASSGKPADVEKNTPGATVIYSNIKVGPIGSTYSGTPAQGGSGGSSSSSKPATSSSTKPATSSSSSSTKVSTTTAGVTTTKPVTTTTTTKAATTTTSSANCAAKYGQCGGKGWGGATCCASGSTCKVSNDYYSQCL
ncbi:hypothetical protein LTR95_003164 [Oleoguttula sp. CCFEE 5521]